MAHDRGADVQVVADVAEALIAAAYLSQSRSLDSAITAIRTLNIPLAAVHRWQDAAIASERNNEPESTEAATESGWMGALTKQSLKVFDYQFGDPKKGQMILVSHTPSVLCVANACSTRYQTLELGMPVSDTSCLAMPCWNTVRALL
jgi:hypothetical protein